MALRQRIVAIVIVAGAGWLQMSWASEPDKGRPATRSAMQTIYERLTVALAATATRVAQDDGDRRREVSRKLRSLADGADVLGTHTAELNPSLEYLRRSLARDARDAADRFDDGNDAGARFVLLKLTDNCVACHSKLPSEQKADFAAGFLRDARLDNLTLEERVGLEVATRQFDRALDTYEQILRSMSVTASQVAMMGIFEDYLSVCLRVKGDVARARAALVEFQKRSDLSRDLDSQIRIWLDALQFIQVDVPAERALEVARDDVRRGREANLFPADRRGIVYFVAASAVLYRFFDSRTATPQEEAEAYYWLGVAESFVSQSYWLSETEYFLEAAIRTAPSSPFAEKAFDFLVSYVTQTYTGSAGFELPADVRERLAELRALLDES